MMMSPPALANRSFLYSHSPGNNNNTDDDSRRQRSPGKLVYATLDSLALKRTTLPLKLLPETGTSENFKYATLGSSKLENPLEIVVVGGKTVRRNSTKSKRPSFKVKSASRSVSPQWKQRMKCSRVNSTKSIDQQHNNTNVNNKTLSNNNCSSLDDSGDNNLLGYSTIGNNNKHYDEIEYSSVAEGGKSQREAASSLANDSFLWSKLHNNNKSKKSEKYDRVYDDVGPSQTNIVIVNQSGDKDESAYDDVGPSTEHHHRARSKNNEEPIYDDVADPHIYQNEDDVYDDVELPASIVIKTSSFNEEPQSRVNSIYASGSLLLNEKESEWEDLEDPESRDESQLQQSSPCSPAKKRVAGQRWPRNKVRRQRSKASRKSSLSAAGSFARRTRRPISESSDDSNYETLDTYENTDDFSSEDDETVATYSNVPFNNHVQNRESLVDGGHQTNNGLSSHSESEAPTRPTPREPSLTQSLGRRMKILKRTWSITKGSLGKRPFSFKKHFGSGRHSLQPHQQRVNSATSSLSTFYLDKDTVSYPSSYSDCYVQAGLYETTKLSGSKVDDDPSNNYSVLAEEPLYQFYAAAAATRGAIESDSDGYEAVEELIPSSATTDLAKPGHRTLWCQTPQVIHSGLLQRLTMEERKIMEAKFEILTSEASYLNSLRVLENEFASNYELLYEVLSSTEREKLFGSVPDVLVASERFLAELEGIWKEDLTLAKLPELLVRHGERSCPAYVKYCSNQVSIDMALKDLRAKKGFKFLETVSRIELKPACHNLSLHSFLMLPMQRITRLPLLADSVLSKLPTDHPERTSWESVLSELSHVVAKCNEGARQAERRNEMEALARKLEYSGKITPINLRDRQLIRSGNVTQLSSKSDTEYKLTFGKKFYKTPLFLMLLTDYLLVTKLKANSNDETYTVMETCKRSLLALESASEDSPFAGRHAMILTLLENHAGRQVEYVITCENETEKERWLDAVSPPKPSIIGETLYESWDCPQVMAVYLYAPRQPDELTLQPGDVINVLRKMNDGWLFGEKLLDGQQGWFPGNFTKEVASEHARARNLRQRHRFLALSGTHLHNKKARQSLGLL